ncbi:Tetratricopeptide repeat protein [compost metagenome]
MWPALLLSTAAALFCAAAGAAPSSARQANPAASALLESAAQDLHAGQLDRAAATLERALRIEPRNPAILHYLGQTRLQQGQYQQAEALAAKSSTLAGSDHNLRESNAWLIAEARQAAEQNLAPAVDDSERLALQQQLDEEIERRRQAEAQAHALREPLGEQERTQATAAEWPADEFQPEWNDSDLMDGPPSPELQKAAFHAGHEWGMGRIPRGHRPPPGLCRIWFPDRPPGRQPPPGNCDALHYHMPAGAWLIRG